MYDCPSGPDICGIPTRRSCLRHENPTKLNAKQMTICMNEEKKQRLASVQNASVKNTSVNAVAVPLQNASVKNASVKNTLVKNTLVKNTTVNAVAVPVKNAMPLNNELSNAQLVTANAVQVVNGQKLNGIPLSNVKKLGNIELTHWDQYIDRKEYSKKCIDYNKLLKCLTSKNSQGWGKNRECKWRKEQVNGLINTKALLTDSEYSKKIQKQIIDHNKKNKCHDKGVFDNFFTNEDVNATNLVTKSGYNATLTNVNATGTNASKMVKENSLKNRVKKGSAKVVHGVSTAFESVFGTEPQMRYGPLHVPNI